MCLLTFATRWLTDWLSDGRAGEGEGERERCRSIKDNNNEAQSEASARCSTVAPGYNEDDVHKLRVCRQTLSNLANAAQGVDCGQQLKSHSHLINWHAAATSCSCSCSNANDAPDMPDTYTIYQIYAYANMCVPLFEGAKAFRDALRPCCNCSTKCNPFVKLFAPTHTSITPSPCLVCIVCACSARTWLAFNAQISLIEFLFTLTKFPTLFSVSRSFFLPLLFCLDFEFEFVLTDWDLLIKSELVRTPSMNGRRHTAFWPASYRVILLQHTVEYFGLIITK